MKNFNEWKVDNDRKKKEEEVAEEARWTPEKIAALKAWAKEMAEDWERQEYEDYLRNETKV